MIWQTVKHIRCKLINAEAALVEKRIYPDDVVLTGEMGVFWVDDRVCLWGTQCSEHGTPCRWAGSNRDYDPFDA